MSVEEAARSFTLQPRTNGPADPEPEPGIRDAGCGHPTPPRVPRRDESLVVARDNIGEAWFRPMGAFLDGRIVAGAAMLSLEVTVPGAGPVPMAALSSTPILAARSRRGLMRKLTTAMLRDARDRGEPLAGLSARDGSLYGQCGFSPATFHLRWEIERQQARFAGAPDNDAMDRLERVGVHDVKAAWPGLHEQIRGTRIGEVSAYPRQWDCLADQPSARQGETYFVLHREPGGAVDGIAHYRIPASGGKKAADTVVVDACEAATPEAYEALWRLLLDMNLSSRIAARHRPIDEPLRWMLGNPRALRVTESYDNLALRILDVATALRLRGYDTETRLVLDISDDTLEHNTGRWELDATPEGACVSRTRARPDVTLDINTLASLYLGGVSAATLAAAGRVRTDRSAVVRRLDRLFRLDAAPFNYLGF